MTNWDAHDDQKRINRVNQVHIRCIPKAKPRGVVKTRKPMRYRGHVSDLLPDMMKPAFPAKKPFGSFFVAKNKGRLPKITFGFFISLSFAAKSLVCCQKLDLLQVSSYLAANH